MVRNLHIRILIVFSVLVLVIVIGSQVYWLTKAYEQQNQVFSYNVQVALGNVVESLCEITGREFPTDNPIEQISGNYFIVRTNDYLDLQSFDDLLTSEIQNRSITDYFEYGVYDCENDRMVFSENVSFIDKSRQTKLPELQNQEYYFGIYFPDRSRYLAGGFDLWKFTSLLAVLIVIFFGYALFVILREKQLSEIQKDFVNNIIHELKTPLTTLSIAAEANAKAPSDQYADIMQKEIQKLQNHINRILENALSERSKPELHPVDASLLIQTIVKEYELNHPEVAFTLKTEPSKLTSHRDYLEIICRNLLDNAIKNGANCIDISLRNQKRKTSIAIQDNGTGIEKEHQKRIFQRFYKIPDIKNQHNQKGFGLGLYIIKTLLKKLNGSISLESDKGNGAKFTVFIPHA